MKKSAKTLSELLETYGEAIVTRWAQSASEKFEARKAKKSKVPPSNSSAIWGTSPKAEIDAKSQSVLDSLSPEAIEALKSTLMQNIE